MSTNRAAARISHRCRSSKGKGISFICTPRENETRRHELWYQEAVAIAESVQTEPQRPRIAGRQFHRANTPADSLLECITSELIQFLFWIILGPKSKRDFPKLILM